MTKSVQEMFFEASGQRGELFNTEGLSESDISPPPQKKYKGYFDGVVVYTLFSLPCLFSIHAVSLELPQESHLSNLWDKKEYADVVFLVDDERVPAHKAILASKSEYFRGLLYGEMKEASMEEIPLPDVPLDAFKKVLQYAYTGIINIEGSLEVRIYNNMTRL